MADPGQGASAGSVRLDALRKAAGRARRTASREFGAAKGSAGHEAGALGDGYAALRVGVARVPEDAARGPSEEDADRPEGERSCYSADNRACCRVCRSARVAAPLGEGRALEALPCPRRPRGHRLLGAVTGNAGGVEVITVAAAAARAVPFQPGQPGAGRPARFALLPEARQLARLGDPLCLHAFTLPFECHASF
jgi:hypothetical protein